jgi:hypothetical protein
MAAKPAMKGSANITTRQKERLRNSGYQRNYVCKNRQARLLFFQGKRMFLR